MIILRKPVILSSFESLDLIYSAGSWLTSGGTYTSISPVLQVYVNGKKEHSDNYTTALNVGEIEIVFNFSTSSSDWVSIDVPTSNEISDIDMVYNSGSWETPTAFYTQVPSSMIVYRNGIKQNDDYYIVSLNSGKLRINFEYISSSSDWVNIIIL